MARLIIAPLLGLVLATTAFAQFPTTDAALIDSLLALRDAHRPDRVDSLAGPAIVVGGAAVIDVRNIRDAAHTVHAGVAGVERGR